MNTHIQLNSVSKSFRSDKFWARGALSRLVSLISRGCAKRNKMVLQDVSISVKSGEIVGIIGRNGSGKSTLLRILAGIYLPDSGDVKVPTRVLYISGFSYGTNPRLTMIENIYLVGAIMGLTKKQISSRLGDIINFSGLSEYININVYKFSSGMIARLNFSIFVFFASLERGDVLLLDEVLNTGGDEEFRKKAEIKMDELLMSGVTMIIVSHNLQDVKRLCKRVICLNDGQVFADGDPDSVIGQYRNLVMSK